MMRSWIRVVYSRIRWIFKSLSSWLQSAWFNHKSARTDYLPSGCQLVPAMRANQRLQKGFKQVVLFGSVVPLGTNRVLRGGTQIGKYSIRFGKDWRRISSWFRITCWQGLTWKLVWNSVWLLEMNHTLLEEMEGATSTFSILLWYS